MTVETVRGLLADKINSAVFLSEYPLKTASALLDEITVTVGLQAQNSDEYGEEETKLAITIYLPFGRAAEKAGEIFSEICSVLRENIATLSLVSRGSIKRDSTLKALVIPCTAVFSGKGECNFLINGKSFDAVSLSISEEIPLREFRSVLEDEAFLIKPERVRYVGEIKSVELGDTDITKPFELRAEDGVYLDCRFTSISHGSSGLAKRVCFRSERRIANES